MKAGDRVRIFPRGVPDQSADATVTISDDLGLALAFDRTPPFAKPGMTYPSRRYDVTIILVRSMLDGKPGPWTDRLTQTMFEIEGGTDE